MHIRNRSSVKTHSEGFAYHDRITKSTGAVVRVWEGSNGPYNDVWSMEDVVGNRNGQNPCYMRTVTRSGGILDFIEVSEGQRQTNIYGYERQPANYFVNLTLSHLKVDGAPSFPDAASEACARTNPSTPSVALPVSIGELRDIPRLFAKKNPKSKGNSVLESEFGWQPLLRDINSLFNFPQLVESRIRTINRLRKGPVTRNVTVWSASSRSEKTDRVITNSSPVYSRSNKWITTTHKSVRAAPRWEASPQVQNLTDKELWRLAARVTLGVESSYALSAIWELLPWSWLIDYFSNLGNLISLTNNSLASLPGGVPVSMKTRTTLQVYSTEPTRVHSPFTGTLTEWERRIVYPTDAPLFRVPILTHGQTSILANLINSLGS